MIASLYHLTHDFVTLMWIVMFAPDQDQQYAVETSRSTSKCENYEINDKAKLSAVIAISYSEPSVFLVSGPRQERLWDNGIVTAGILQLTVLHCMFCYSE